MDDQTASTRARQIWARTTLHVWPEPYVLTSMPERLRRAAAALLASQTSGFAAMVVERDEVSITLPQADWVGDHIIAEARVAGPFRVITFDVSIELDVCGYLAPAATLLAEAGVAIIPQCGFLKDHLVVHEEHLATAVAVLNSWIRSCQGR